MKKIYAKEILIKHIEKFLSVNKGYSGIEEMIAQPEFNSCIDAMEEYAINIIKEITAFDPHWENTYDKAIDVLMCLENKDYENLETE